MAELTDSQLADLAANLEGTSATIEAGLEWMGLDTADYDESEIEAELMGQNLERCPTCGWWVESWELADDEGNPKACDQCEPPKRE